ncbi:hypothetical protein L6452_09280 [Arctium lappa]|uniref:Uncharacterized protein n=1 Tax=Arctium lappa TaxID=4217 RepID=A0ACB9DKF1_ARCLA|nr:hypothetical protein L6452_09280 [Arctium lappa]
MVPISNLQEARRFLKSSGSPKISQIFRKPEDFSNLQEPEDFSIFRNPKISQSSEARRFLKSLGSRKFLNHQEPEDFSHLQEPEDFSPLPTCLSIHQSCQHFKTKSPQDKRYIMYHAEDLCLSLAQQVSFALNA